MIIVAASLQLILGGLKRLAGQIGPDRIMILDWFLVSCLAISDHGHGDNTSNRWPKVDPLRREALGRPD